MRSDSSASNKRDETDDQFPYPHMQPLKVKNGARESNVPPQYLGLFNACSTPPSTQPKPTPKPGYHVLPAIYLLAFSCARPSLFQDRSEPFLFLCGTPPSRLQDPAAEGMQCSGSCCRPAERTDRTAFLKRHRPVVAAVAVATALEYCKRHPDYRMFGTVWVVHLVRMVALIPVRRYCRRNERGNIS
jgi:hypothetical protein